MDIKLFKMDFGESLLITQNNEECLLVDCGSEGTKKLKFFQAVENEIQFINSRKALLTHFHEDHINGFIDITTRNIGWFDTVYIPYIFTVGNHPNAVDFALIQYILERYTCAGSRKLSVWDLLKLLVKSDKSIKLLQREKDAFQLFGKNVNVLWPVPNMLVDEKLWNSVKKELPILNEYENQIFSVSDQISREYLSLEESRGDYTDSEGIESIGNQLDEIDLIFGSQLPERETQNIIRKLRQKANETSIVCQIDAGKPTLLTGDITSKIMKGIAENKYAPSIPLFDYYYAIKAPHHGTQTHYFNFGPFTRWEKLLISNGVTRKKKRGKITCQYNLKSRNYAIICTNDAPWRCECFGSCVGKCANPNDICGCKSNYILL